jgi:hypothetical protein
MMPALWASESREFGTAPIRTDIDRILGQSNPYPLGTGLSNPHLIYPHWMLRKLGYGVNKTYEIEYLR